MVLKNLVFVGFIDLRALRHLSGNPKPTLLSARFIELCSILNDRLFVDEVSHVTGHASQLDACHLP